VGGVGAEPEKKGQKPRKIRETGEATRSTEIEGKIQDPERGQAAEENIQGGATVKQERDLLRSCPQEERTVELPAGSDRREQRTA